MPQKLEYEVDVKTDKAKQKIAQDLGSVEGGGSGATDAVSRSADKAAKALDRVGKSADSTGAEMGRMVKAFTGIGVGLATSYASSFLPEGKMRDGVGIVGQAIAGAGAGSVFGPWGSLIAGVASAGKGIMDMMGQEKTASNDFKRGEAHYQRALQWKKDLEGYADVGDDPTTEIIEEKIAQIREKLEERKRQEEELVKGIEGFIENHEYRLAAINQENLALNRQHQATLEGMEKAYSKKLESMAEDRSGNPLAVGATDAISAIGGDMAGGQGASIAQTNRLLADSGKGIAKTAEFIERIHRKLTSNKWGGTF